MKNIRKYALEDVNVEKSKQDYNVVDQEILTLTPNYRLSIVSMSVSDSPLYNYVLLVELSNKKGEVEWATGVPFDSLENMKEVEDLLLDKSILLGGGKDVDTIISNLYSILSPFLEVRNAFFYGIRTKSGASYKDMTTNFYHKLSQQGSTNDINIDEAARDTVDTMIAIYEGGSGPTAAALLSLSFTASQLLDDLLQEGETPQVALNKVIDIPIIPNVISHLYEFAPEYGDEFENAIEKGVDWSSIVRRSLTSLLRSNQHQGTFLQLVKYALVEQEDIDSAVSLMCQRLDEGEDVENAFNFAIQQLATTIINDSMIGEDQSATEAINYMKTVPMQNQLLERFNQADGGKYRGYLSAFAPYINSLDWAGVVEREGAKFMR